MQANQKPLNLFSFTTTAFNDEALVSMPGLEYRGQPFKARVLWYPFEEWHCKAYLRADNRRQAVKQIEHAGVFCRDLDGGRRWL